MTADQWPYVVTDRSSDAGNVTLTEYPESDFPGARLALAAEAGQEITFAPPIAAEAGQDAGLSTRPPPSGGTRRRQTGPAGTGSSPGTPRLPECCPAG